MIYTKFGNTGISISSLGFGAMRLPSSIIDGKEVFDNEAGIQIIQKAIELGVNYIDTAPYYCNKESEIIVGQALKDCRKDVYLSTKNPIENGSGDDWTKRLESSLNKLDTDYIDFYHMWGISWKSFVEKIDVKNGPLEAAMKAKEQGLIRHLSFSFHDDPDKMFKLIDTGYFESVLCQYNLLDRRNEEGIKYAQEKGLGVIAMGPVGGGRLGQPSAEIQKLLPGKVSSSAELALRFVFSNDNVNCALSGMGNLQMVEENVATASKSNGLTSEEKSQIDESLEENRKLAELYCTDCKYCMPCPHGVNIPRNFQLMNYHKVYGQTAYAVREYSLLKDEGEKDLKASACVECGECEPKCPQHIEIIKQLKETDEALATVL